VLRRLKTDPTVIADLRQDDEIETKLKDFKRRVREMPILMSGGTTKGVPEAMKKLLEVIDTSRRANRANDEIVDYENAWRSSPVGKDLFLVRNVKPLWSKFGTVIGVAYILAFNVPPIEITGTALILIVCNVFRNMPVGVRAGMAAMSQIDKSLDEASTVLGARGFTTLRTILLPLLKPAVIAALVYSFVRAMTTLSAVIFLVSAEYRGDYRLHLVFDSGEAAEVDLREAIFSHEVARPLREPEAFARFHLTTWPTLEWDCGFDLAGGQVEVVPTAHYMMCGVEFGVDTSTELEGLFAAGEVTSSGLRSRTVKSASLPTSIVPF
jgi:hypothetical protein